MLVSILHPVGGDLNTLCQRGVFEYEHVAHVEAPSLAEAFRMAQNDFSEEYRTHEIRSTSVGDILIAEGKHYFVRGDKFQEIPPTVAQHMDWGNHMEVHNELPVVQTKNGIKVDGVFIKEYGDLTLYFSQERLVLADKANREVDTLDVADFIFKSRVQEDEPTEADYWNDGEVQLG